MRVWSYFDGIIMRTISFLPRTIALAGLLFSVIASIGANNSNIQTLRDIPYKLEVQSEYEKERCKLDLYLPADRNAYSTLLWFHGGGLQNGDKGGDMEVAIARRFASDGIAVAVVNYRLSPKAKFPGYIEDAAASFTWMFRNIEKHGGDPGRIFVSGHSAGGYLTAMIAMDPQYLSRHRLQVNTIRGLIPVSGQMITHSTVRNERGIEKTTPIIDAAAPSFHARKNTPPFLNIFGSNDLAARAEENTYFVAAMKAAGHEHVEYLGFEGRNHSTIANRLPEKDDPVALAILKFIEKLSQ